jgi:hypothetical protein
MNLLQKLRNKLTSSRYPADYWPSVVVLMAEPWFPTKDDVLARAQKAWGNAGQATLVGTLRDGASQVIKCGSMSFSIHFANARYGGGSSGGDEILQRPWDAHRAWMSVDLPDMRNESLHRAGELGKMYKVLLIFVFLCWTNNCLAVYFPGEGVTILNLGDLASCIQWGRRNGLNLHFLD